MLFKRKEITDRFRVAVLSAFDRAAEAYTGKPRTGWTDADIAELLRVIDRQAEKVMLRNNLIIVDEPSEAFIKSLERAYKGGGNS